jgi:hypothetical protein
MRAGYANRRLRIRMHGSIHDPTARVRQEVVACQNRCRRVSLVTTLAKDLPSSVYTRGRGNCFVLSKKKGYMPKS